MISGWLVACLFEVVFTFLRCEGVEEAGEGGGDGLGGARSFFAQQMVELGEELLDGVEVGRVFRQEEELGPGGSDGLTYGFAPVAAEVVHHDDLIWLERGGENLLDMVRRLWPLIGPFMSQGASTRSWRRAARNVIVCQRPCGTLTRNLWPRGAHPLSGAMLVLVQVSSMKTRRSGAIRP